MQLPENWELTIDYCQAALAMAEENLKTLSILAFDFGTTRIGIAYGQTATMTTMPLAEISAQDGIPSWEIVASYVKEWKPNGLLIGLPINMDGTENEMCQRARKFAKRLHGRFGLPAWLWDERLSSREARERIERSGKKRYVIDSVAAEAILESWFENGCPKERSCP
jgi:putative Holliday junction resolvase